MPYSYPRCTPDFARVKYKTKKGKQQNSVCKLIKKQKLSKNERAFKNASLIEKRLHLQLNCVFHEFTQNDKHICVCEDRIIHKIKNRDCKPENANRCKRPEKCMYTKNLDSDTILYSTTVD